MKTRLVQTIILVLISLIMLTACAQPTATQPPVEPTKEMVEEPTEEPMEEPTEEMAEVVPDLGTINVGYMPILGFVPFMVAQELGYFAEQGLEVELVSFRTGGDMIAPLSLGQLDVGGGESGPGLFNAIDQDLDVGVVAALASQPEGRGAVPLLVRTDLLESGEISEIADLAGRKVALNVERGMAEYLLAEALAQAGLTVDDVEIVALPFPDVPVALANSAVDAAILPYPLAGITLRPGENDEPPIAGVLIPGDQISDNPQNGVVYFGKRILDPENKEVAIRFLVAFLKAAREVQGDEWRENDDIINAILAYTTVPEPAIRNGVAYYFDPNGQINTDSIADIQAYHFDRGYTNLGAPLTMEQFLLLTYLEEALSRLGEFQE